MNTKLIFLLVILIIVSNVNALDYSTNSANIDVASVRSGTAPNWQGLTGKEVIIGIISTGLDINHKDFKDPISQKTRVLYYWDQSTSSASPGNPPIGFNYGRECTKTQIDTNTCIPNSAYVDNDGTGTHLTGIVAGNGQDFTTTSSSCITYPALCQQYLYIGIAPQSDIIIVKTNYITYSSNDISIGYAVDAVNYIFQKAESLNKDAVILLDGDYNYGSRDSTDPLEKQLNELTGNGKIIVAHAGKEGNTNYHAKWAPQTLPYELSISFTQPSPTSSEDIKIEGWYYKDDSLEVGIESPNGYIVGPIQKGGYTTQFQCTTDGCVSISNYETNSDGDNKIAIELMKIGSTHLFPGEWKIKIKPIIQTKDVNFWISDYQLGLPKPTFIKGLSQDTTITTPASGLNLISVGSYKSRQSWINQNGANILCISSTPLNTISTLSGRGPRLTTTDTISPDLVAPGQCIVSSKSQYASISGNVIVPDQKHYVLSSGPPLAAAHVAGAVALMLQKCPDLTPAEAKDMLKNLTIADGYTGSVPNNIYGNGKLKLKQFTCINDQDNDGCVNTQDFNPILSCSKNTCKADNSLCDSTCKPIQCDSNQKCVSNNLGNKVCTDLPPQKKIVQYSPDTFSTVFAVIILLIAFLIYFTNIERDGKKTKR